MERRIAAVVLALVASVVLVSCSSASPAEDLLKRTAVPSDALPEWAGFDYAPDATRLLGERDGVSYFLAKSGSAKPDDGLCVVAVAEKPLAMSGCGGIKGGSAGGGAGLGSWRFEPGGFVAELVDEDWVLVHPTLAVRR